MLDLTPRHEAFCQSYAAIPNGAAAARLAGFAPANAAHQAHALLQRADITARLAELNAETAAERARATDELMAKLEPVYLAGLEAGDHDTVIQVVELQARIAGLVHGAAAVRPRMARAGQAGETVSHEAALAQLAGFDVAGLDVSSLDAPGPDTPIKPHETP